MEDAIFEKIYDGTASQLWAYIARISASTTAADDILQETYLRFLRSPPRQNTMIEARPYLYKIATNLIHDRFRRMKHESPAAIDEALLIDVSTQNNQRGPEMMQVFSRLRYQERCLLWLAYVEGYEHREIAGILKINSLSVRVLLYRARHRLAQLLDIKKK